MIANFSLTDSGLKSDSPLLLHHDQFDLCFASYYHLSAVYHHIQGSLHFIVDQ